MSFSSLLADKMLKKVMSSITVKHFTLEESSYGEKDMKKSGGFVSV